MLFTDRGPCESLARMASFTKRKESYFHVGKLNGRVKLTGEFEITEQSLYTHICFDCLLAINREYYIRQNISSLVNAASTINHAKIIKSTKKIAHKIKKMWR